MMGFDSIPFPTGLSLEVCVYAYVCLVVFQNIPLGSSKGKKSFSMESLLHNFTDSPIVNAYFHGSKKKKTQTKETTTTKQFLLPTANLL